MVAGEPTPGAAASGRWRWGILIVVVVVIAWGIRVYTGGGFSGGDWDKGECPQGMYRVTVGTNGDGPGGFQYTCVAP